MKKQLKLLKTIMISLFCSMLFTLLDAKAPFGKCEKPILKKATTKTTPKKKGNWDIMPDQSEEIQLTEDTLINTIDRTAPFIRAEDPIRWINLLSCIYSWIESSKFANKKQYLNDMEQFYFISEIANGLAQEFEAKRTRLTDAQKDAWIETAVTMLKKVITINVATFPLFAKSSNNSSQWKNKVPVKSKLQQLYIEFGNELKNFITEQKGDNRTANYDAYFKDSIEALDAKDLQLLVNKLEILLYRFNHSYFPSSTEVAIAAFCQKYLNYIYNHFGAGLYFESSSYADRYNNSKDIATKTTLKISKKLFDALYDIIRKLKLPR